MKQHDEIGAVRRGALAEFDGLPVGPERAADEQAILRPDFWDAQITRGFQMAPTPSPKKLQPFEADLEIREGFFEQGKSPVDVAIRLLDQGAELAPAFLMETQEGNRRVRPKKPARDLKLDPRNPGACVMPDRMA